MRDFDDPFEDIFEEIQEMVGSIMGSLEDGGQIQSGSEVQTDIQELEEEMIITVDLQGFEKEEISIKCNGFVLLVNAKNIDLEVNEQIVLPKIGNSGKYILDKKSSYFDQIKSFDLNSELDMT